MALNRNRNRRYSMLLRVTGCVLMAIAATQVCAATADDIKALVDQGKFADAYALGGQHPEEIGNPAFDFFYGIAAINTGNAGPGVLALERYLLNFPDNISARLQLARGYFILGEDARAREEFEALRKLNPPTDVAATIDRFLDAIRLRQTRYMPSAGAYIELGGGYDSNINSGVANANIFLPTLGPLTISQSGQKLGSGFASLAGGGYGTYPIAPGVALFGNAAGEQKFDTTGTGSQYQLGTVDLSGGVSILREKNLYKLSLNQGYVTVGDRTYREATGGQIEWQHQLDELQSISLGGQYANLRYNDPNSPMDAELWGSAASYRKQFTGRWQPALNVSANYSVQDTSQSRPDLVPRTWGSTLGVSFTPAAKWGVSAAYTYLQSNYRGLNFLAGDTRRDQYQAFNGVVAYLLTNKLSVRGEMLISRNASNISLYTFPRDVFAIKLRYEFK